MGSNREDVSQQQWRITAAQWRFHANTTASQRRLGVRIHQRRRPSVASSSSTIQWRRDRSAIRRANLDRRHRNSFTLISVIILRELGPQDPAMNRGYCISQCIEKKTRISHSRDTKTIEGDDGRMTYGQCGFPTITGMKLFLLSDSGLCFLFLLIFLLPLLVFFANR